MGQDVSRASDASCSGAKHLANRAKKDIEVNARKIQNRIQFFKREEETIWRDLEEVRRQAATIEEGRSRALQKKLADRTIQQAKELRVQQNKMRVTMAKTVSMDTRKKTQFDAMKEKQAAGEEQRRFARETLRRKQLMQDEARLANYERAVAIQRERIEAKLKQNQEKTMRIELLREAQEREKELAELAAQSEEARLPHLEAEEMLCLQRLQNSRVVTQSMLQELETSLGARNSVTSMLRLKQKGKTNIEHVDANQCLCSASASEVVQTPTKSIPETELYNPEVVAAQYARTPELAS